MADIPRFAHGARHAVRYLSGAGLTGPGAVGARNPLGAGFTGVTASGVRDATGHTLFTVGAGGVWYALGAAFTSHVARGVRHTTGAGLAGPGASSARDAFDGGARHAMAHGVRHTAVLDFWNHSGAADLLGNHLWHPDAAAHHATTRLARIFTAAASGAAVSARSRATGIAAGRRVIARAAAVIPTEPTEQTAAAMTAT